jgi:hypothetical protein
MIDVADTHAGSLGNDGHAGAMEPVRPEAFQGRFQDLLAPCFTARLFHRCIACQANTPTPRKVIFF